MLNKSSKHWQMNSYNTKNIKENEYCFEFWTKYSCKHVVRYINASRLESRGALLIILSIFVLESSFKKNNCTLTQQLLISANDSKAYGYKVYN